MANEGDASTKAFFTIAHCDVAFDLLDGRIVGSHPCREIVCSQSDDATDFQLPEPWVGHLESAPLLFVASNPSIGDDNRALRDTTPTIVWDSHVNLFDESSGYTSGGIYARLPDGSRSKRWVAHWAFVRSQASAIFGRLAIPGKDYAMTEVVHCKSRGERGVSAAAEFCTDRFFRRVLDVSACRVVVVMGAHARREITRTFAIAPDALHANLPGERHAIFVPHSNFRGRRKVADLVPADMLAQLRSACTASSSVSPPVIAKECRLQTQPLPLERSAIRGQSKLMSVDQSSRRDAAKPKCSNCKLASMPSSFRS